MRADQRRALRIAEGHGRALWAFAYPVQGRRFPALRRVALRLWAVSLRLRLRLCPP